MNSALSTYAVAAGGAAGRTFLARRGLAGGRWLAAALLAALGLLLAAEAAQAVVLVVEVKGSPESEIITCLIERSDPWRFYGQRRLVNNGKTTLSIGPGAVRLTVTCGNFKSSASPVLDLREAKFMRISFNYGSDNWTIMNVEGAPAATPARPALPKPELPKPAKPALPKPDPAMPAATGVPRPGTTGTPTQPPLPTTGAYATVEVTVMDAASTAPLADAEVQINSEKTNGDGKTVTTALTGRTNAWGKVVFTAPELTHGVTYGGKAVIMVGQSFTVSVTSVSVKGYETRAGQAKVIKADASAAKFEVPLLKAATDPGPPAKIAEPAKTSEPAKTAEPAPTAVSAKP